jgi:hypothetical protein
MTRLQFAKGTYSIELVSRQEPPPTKFAVCIQTDDADLLTPEPKCNSFDRENTVGPTARERDEKRFQICSERMSTAIQAELPPELLAQARAFVEAGWATDVNELLAEALRRHLESHSSQLSETFIRADVEWGLNGDECR